MQKIAPPVHTRVAHLEQRAFRSQCRCGRGKVVRLRSAGWRSAAHICARIGLAPERICAGTSAFISACACETRTHVHTCTHAHTHARDAPRPSAGSSSQSPRPACCAARRSHSAAQRPPPAACSPAGRASPAGAAATAPTNAAWLAHTLPRWEPRDARAAAIGHKARNCSVV